MELKKTFINHRTHLSSCNPFQVPCKHPGKEGTTEHPYLAGAPFQAPCKHPGKEGTTEHPYLAVTPAPFRHPVSTREKRVPQNTFI